MSIYIMDPDDLRETISKQKTEIEPRQKSAQEDKSEADRDARKNPQELYSWKAPLRAYKKRSVGVLRFYIALGLLLSLIAFFMGERILVLPISATVFLVYVLTITPPPTITNKITKFGIETAGQAVKWDSLSHFYYAKRFDYDVLVIVGREPYNTHLYLVLQHPHIKEMTLKLLSEHLIYQEKPRKTLTDRMADWLTTLMPNEETQAAS